MKEPWLTIVCIFFNNRREAPRTLYSLSTTYQKKMSSGEYRVIAIDSNSSQPLDADMVSSFGPQFEYHYVSSTDPTPVDALDFGWKLVKSSHVMFLIDGAHILTPGILSACKELISIAPQNFIYTKNFHLGKFHQNEGMLHGYSQESEDRLLESIAWKDNGYRLFEVSSIYQEFYSFYENVSESNCFVISKEKLDGIGAYDIGFRTKGGGLANLDIFRRIIDNTEDENIFCLIGEATFHQFHGGSSTNIAREDHPILLYRHEYQELRSGPFKVRDYYPRFHGFYPPELKSIMPHAPFRSWMHIASYLKETGQRAEALMLLKNARKIYPYNLSVIQKTTLLYIGMNQLDLARNEIEEAIRIDLTSGANWVLHGDILRGQDQSEEAIESYGKALKYDPGVPRAVIGRLIALYQMEGFLEDSTLTESFENMNYTRLYDRDLDPLAQELMANQDYELLYKIIVHFFKDVEKPRILLHELRAVQKLELKDDIDTIRHRLLKSILDVTLSDYPTMFLLHITNALLPLGDSEGLELLMLRMEMVVRKDKLQWLSKLKIQERLRHEDVLLENIALAKEYVPQMPSRLSRAAVELMYRIALREKNRLAAKEYLKVLVIKHAYDNHRMRQCYFNLYDDPHAIRQVHQLSCLYENYTKCKYNYFVGEMIPQSIDEQFVSKKEKNLFNPVLRHYAREVRKVAGIEEKRRPIQFVHIQKTGGTSLREFLVESALYSGVSPEKIYSPSHLGVDNKDVFVLLSPMERKSLLKSRGGYFTLLADHSEKLAEEYGLNFPEKPFYIAALRNPYNWFRSMYRNFYFQPAESKYHHITIDNLSPHQGLKLFEKYSNLQTKMLAGLPWYLYEECPQPEADLNSILSQIDCLMDFDDMQSGYERLCDCKPDWLRVPYDRFPSLNVKDYILDPFPEHLIPLFKEYFEKDIEAYRLVKLSYS